MQAMYDEEMEALQAKMPVVAVSQEGSLQSPAACPSTADVQEISGKEKMAANLFPKVPFAALGPYIIAAERRIKWAWCRGPGHSHCLVLRFVFIF